MRAYTYDTITDTGLCIHLSMTIENICYILVYDLYTLHTTMKFFTTVEDALDFIHSL
jgi:hypothetical protein